MVASDLFPYLYYSLFSTRNLSDLFNKIHSRYCSAQSPFHVSAFHSLPEEGRAFTVPVWSSTTGLFLPALLPAPAVLGTHRCALASGPLQFCACSWNALPDALDSLPSGLFSHVTPWRALPCPQCQCHPVKPPMVM